MQRHQAVLAVLGAILPFTACKSGGDAWSLQLFPHVVKNQAPFEEADTFRIVLERDNGGEEVYEFDADNTVSLGGANALIKTPIRVEIVTDDEIRATGRTGPITQSRGERELGVLIANTESVAFLEGLEKGLYLSTLTPLGNGRFLSTGGLKMLGLLDDGEPNDDIRLLDLGGLDPEAVPTLETIGTLPAYVTEGGETRTARHAHTATLLSEPAELAGQILVTGGTHSLLDSPGVTASAFLLDPETGEATELPEEEGLREPREEHIAVANSSGDVVFFGGWTYTASTTSFSATNTMEVFDAAEQRFRQVRPRDTSLFGRRGYGFAASMPTVGVMHCGGVGGTSSGLWLAVTDCILVDLSRNVETIASLPVPLAHASMVALSNHQVLVTGGLQVTTELNTGEPTAASSEAWLYDHDSREWSPAGLMKRPRNRHKSVVLPDGRVLIIGGRSNGTAFAEHDTSDFEDCLEIYDPVASSTDPFQLLDGCSQSTGSGQALESGTSLPAVAMDPDFGALIVGGLSNSGAAKSINLWVPAVP